MSKQLAIACLLCTAHLSAHADSPIVFNPENGHRYQRFDTVMTWQEAKAFCESTGGYLSTITSETEDVFVWNNLAYSSPNGGSWLGATDEIAEGEWLWITGEPWAYSNWNEGEPNNYCSSCPEGLLDENYLHLYTFSRVWNDDPSGGYGTLLSTICESEGNRFASFSSQAELEFGPRSADDSFQGTAKFELNPDSNGIDPVYEDVRLTLGTLSITIPAGSFTAWRQGESSDKVRFRGVIDGVRMTVEIYSRGSNDYMLWIKGRGAKLDGLVLPPVITLTIGDEYGKTKMNSVKAKFKSTKGKHGKR